VTSGIRWYWLLLQVAAVLAGIWAGIRIFQAVTA
jgi:hypothetical protein